jgi:hypothetical protein
MPRARWFVIGFMLVATLVGGVLNARGPFAAHRSLAYAQLLADFEAGRVERIVQWRDQLEVTESGELLIVTVPPEKDLAVDLAQARLAGGVGIDFAQIPDSWLSTYTPWVPVLLLVAGALIWGTGIARNRRAVSWPDAAERARQS